MLLATIDQNKKKQNYALMKKGADQTRSTFVHHRSTVGAESRFVRSHQRCSVGRHIVRHTSGASHYLTVYVVCVDTAVNHCCFPICHVLWLFKVERYCRTRQAIRSGSCMEHLRSGQSIFVNMLYLYLYINRTSQPHGTSLLCMHILPNDQSGLICDHIGGHWAARSNSKWPIDCRLFLKRGIFYIMSKRSALSTTRAFRCVWLCV